MKHFSFYMFVESFHSIFNSLSEGHTHGGFWSWRIEDVEQSELDTDSLTTVWKGWWGAQEQQRTLTAGPHGNLGSKMRRRNFSPRLFHKTWCDLSFPSF